MQLRQALNAAHHTGFNFDSSSAASKHLEEIFASGKMRFKARNFGKSVTQIGTADTVPRVL
jgi:hypothetical protein